MAKELVIKPKPDDFGKANAYAEATRSVMERVVRILLRRANTHVNLSQTSIATGFSEIPAWTDGQDIFLNHERMKGAFKSILSGKPDKFNSALDKYVLLIKGMVYHEMLHILFTPRGQSDYRRILLQQSKNTSRSEYSRIMPAFMILEDQRIEMFGYKLYPLMGKYFGATVAEIILGSKDTVWMDSTRGPDPRQYQLICGRKYLPKKVRSKLRDEFSRQFGESRTQQFESVVHKYQRLDLIAGSAVEQAVDLVLEAARLLVVDRNTSSCPSMSNGPNKGYADQKATQVAVQMMNEDSEKNGDESEDADDSSSGSGNKGSKGSDKPAQSEGDAIKEALKEVSEDKVLKVDVKSVSSSIKSVASSTDAGQLPAAADYVDKPVTGDMLTVSKQIVERLQRIKFDTDSSILFGQPAGRINIRRMTARQPHDFCVFDQWSEDLEKETGIEVVLLVDISGSMAGFMSDVSKILWSLKHALQTLDTPTTVILYNYDSFYAYRKNERISTSVYRQYVGDGGTSPKSALEEALRIFKQSSTVNKVLVTVTDGQWGEVKACETLVDEINKLVVSSMLVNFSVTYHVNMHHHTLLKSMYQFNELPTQIAGLVNVVISKALKNISNPT